MKHPAPKGSLLQGRGSTKSWLQLLSISAGKLVLNTVPGVMICKGLKGIVWMDAKKEMAWQFIVLIYHPK